MKCALCNKPFDRVGRQIYCSEACKKKVWNTKNKGKIAEYMRTYAGENRESIRLRKEKWNRSEKGITNRKEWYLSHRDEIIKKMQAKPDYRQQLKNGKRARNTLKKHRPKVCEVCSTTVGFIDAHHIDKDRYNNDISNLKWLCRKHHAILHASLNRPTF